MDAPQTEQVVLELFPGEPISGRIRGSGGPTESFRGWLELASKVERMRMPQADVTAEPAKDS
jgi:hypothetical protein